MMKKLLYIILGVVCLSSSSRIYSADDLRTLIKNSQVVSVRSRYDLEGQTVIVPDGKELYIRAGSLVNGTIKGSNTILRVKSLRSVGVSLKGSWIAEVIDDSFFDRTCLTDNQVIDNICNLQSDDVHNSIRFNGRYKIKLPGNGVGLVLRSNTILSGSGDLSIDGNELKSYKILCIDGKKNVSVSGISVTGDVCRHKYIENSTSEWGHGVYINSSENVTVRDVSVSRCTGDGFSISGGSGQFFGDYSRASKNILLERVKSTYNRRLGISIIHVDGLVLKDSDFSHTGKLEMTKPATGIDIEPNTHDSYHQSARRIRIINCTMMDNALYAMQTSLSYQTDGIINLYDISVERCVSDGDIKTESTQIEYRDCAFRSLFIAGVHVPTSMVFDNCSFTGGDGIYLYAPTSKTDRLDFVLEKIRFNRCTISVGTSNQKSAIDSYRQYVDNTKQVVFDSCTITIPENLDPSYSLIDDNWGDKMLFRNCTVRMKRHDLRPSASFENCRIVCHDIIGSESLLQNNNIVASHD